MNSVAVIGAGLSGATAAVKLAEAGYQVCVFDKGRSVGGRMSSKKTEAGYLDMGAQYFTARSAMFQRQVDSWVESGHAEAWNCTTASLTGDEGRALVESSVDQQLRYVGIPSMQSPVKAMLADIPVTLNCRIDSLQRHHRSWSVISEAGECYPDYSAVVLTVPPVQADLLLVQSGLTGLREAEHSLLEPCWAVAIYADGTPHEDAIFCQHPKLRFVSHQATKPGRYSCYILHFNATFSAQNIEQPVEFWFEQAAGVVQSALGIDTPVERVAAHRWLYASQSTALSPPGLLARPNQQLWIGGDWSYGGRVENAYLAGEALAASVIKHFRRAGKEETSLSQTCQTPSTSGQVR